MIKYNNSNINDWNFGDDNIIKVYRNNAVCYYKVSSTSPTAQTPCFAVVDDISLYTDTEFEDVYDKATEKWYKLNNLNQYEEYGVYGTSTAVTYYQGKLAIVDDYEYMYSGSNWNNVGEVSGGSRVPEGYTEVEYVENTSTAYVDLNVYPYSATTNSYEIETKISSTQGTAQFEYLFSCEQGNASPYYGCLLRWQRSTPIGLLLGGNPDNTTKSIIDNGDGTSAITLTCTETQGSNTTPMTLWCGKSGNTVWRNGKGKFYTFKLTVNNSLVRDMIPCKRDSDNVAGMYDIVNNTFYASANRYNLVAGAETSGGTIYPMYYDEMQDPPNNLVFSSMTEAESYECPWVGMQATIDGDNYVFSGNSQSGYEWVEVALPYDAQVEYLESSGSQYINTGIYLNKSNFEVGYVLDGYPSGTQWGYVHQNVANGAWVTVNNNLAFMGRWSTNGSYDLKISAYTSSTQNTIIYNNSGVQINGTTLTKILSLTTTDNIETIPLHFFAHYDFYKKGLEYGSCKFKSFYVKNNNELVVDMIPVRVGQVGYMYDRVSGQLFSNAGTGQFILGPDV